MPERVGIPPGYGREATFFKPEATITQPLATLPQQEATIGCRLPVHVAQEPPAERHEPGDTLPVTSGPPPIPQTISTEIEK